MDPPGQVYGVVARDFFLNYPRWSLEVKRLEALTSGPLRLGSRGRQVRVDRGRRSESAFRVTALDEPVRLEFAEDSDRFRIAYRLDPIGEQTRLFFTFESIRLEIYRLPFQKPIRVAVQDGAERTIRSIKWLVERETVRRKDAGGG
jgi:hypothetical protein